MAQDRIVSDIWRHRREIAELGVEAFLQKPTWPSSYLAGIPEGSWMRQYVHMAACYPELDEAPSKNMPWPHLTKASDLFESMAFEYVPQWRYHRGDRTKQYLTQPEHRLISDMHQGTFRAQTSAELERCDQGLVSMVWVAAKPKPFLEEYGNQNLIEGLGGFSTGWEATQYGQLLILEAKSMIGSIWATFIKEWDLPLTPMPQFHKPTEANGNNA